MVKKLVVVSNPQKLSGAEFIEDSKRKVTLFTGNLLQWLKISTHGLNT